MTAATKPRLLFAAGFAILFAVAFWFRTSSLEAFTWHNGDESYYGIQATRLLRGEAIALRTPTQSILNFYLVAMQGLIHLVAQPSLWALRAPAVLCGALAVVLTYVLGARVLDRATALIAAVLLATLPCAVYQSRIGLEQSQVPLFGLIVIACALRGRGLGLLVSFLASMLVHPTDVFLIPIALPVFLVQLHRKGEGDPARRRRMLIVSLAVVAAISVLVLNHPLAQAHLKHHPRLNWRNFFGGYERLLFFLYYPTSATAIRLHRWGFRGVLLVLLVLGTGRLVRRRQWERLALIAGLAASLSGFHLVAGPRVLRLEWMHRYGVVFLTPTVLAFACLLRGLLPDPSPEESTSRIARYVPHAVALAFGCVLLLCTKLNVIDPNAVDYRESIWTFRSDAKDVNEQVLSLVRRDIARSRAGRDLAAIDAAGGPTPVSIIAQDYWVYMPLAYLVSSSEDLEVIKLIRDEERGRSSDKDIVREKERELIERLRSGAYAIERVGDSTVWPGKVVENTVRSSFSPEQVQRWEILSRNGSPALFVYHLKDAPASLVSMQPAPADGEPGARPY